MSTPTTTTDAAPTRARRPPARHTVLGAGLLVVGMVGFAGVYAVSVLTRVGQETDNALMDAVAVSGLQHEQLAEAVPNPYLLLVAAGVLALVGAVRQWRSGVAVAVAVPVLVVSTQVLKAVLPRPHLADQWVMDNSLPSGHTGAAAALAVALLLVSPRLLAPVAAVAGVAVTGYMGGLVVMLGYHRPSDVLASALLALAALGLGVLVRGRVPERALPGPRA